MNIKINRKKVMNVLCIVIAIVVMCLILFPLVWLIPGAWKSRIDIWHIPPANPSTTPPSA